MVQKQSAESQLDAVFEKLKQRHGAQIVRPLSQVSRSTTHRFTTTYSQLDQLLHGGLLQDGICEFVGSESTGMSTVVLRIVEQVQTKRQRVAFLDCRHTFDASYAKRHGVDLQSLLLVQPQTVKMALSIAETLVKHGGCKLVIFDSLPDVVIQKNLGDYLDQFVFRLYLAAKQKQAAVIFLNNTLFSHLLANRAVVRLGFKKMGWLWQRGDVIGCRTKVTVMRNKGHKDGGQITLEISFKPNSQTDTTWWA